MTRAQLDSIVRSARALTNVEPGANGRPAPMSFAFPPRSSMDRQAFDARMAHLGPPRHVIIADPPADHAHPDVQPAGTAVMDELRKQLAGNERYVVVNQDSTNAALARSRNRDSVMIWLGGDMNVSIRAFSTPSRDSVRWQVTLFDPTSITRSQTINLGPVARSGDAPVTDTLARLASRALWQLDHTPRREIISVAPGITPPSAPTPPVIKKP
jgi:hypothetical protein